MALTRPRIAQINTNITALTDAITVLNAGATSANVDSGFLINRAHGLISNAAIYYSETLDTFVTAFTSNSGGTDSNIVISSYVDFTTGNVFSTGISSTGNVDFRFSPNVNLGTVSNIIITGGQSGQILQTLGNGELTWVDNTPTTVTYTANSIALTGGVYVSGSITDIQTFGDYGAGNVYVLTDGSGSAPAWYVDIDFLSVANFNRVVLNINYTQSSGHTIYVQLYNNTTSAWDSIGTYTGLGSYYAFALQVINDANYINAGTVQLRLYHSNAGAISHQTSIDYAALELSNQGPQGPRGPTGATGATGSGVASGGTAGQILVKNSSTNYDTAWASNLTLANLNIVGIGDVSANIGSYQTWANTALIATNNAIITANTGMKSYVDDQIIIASGYGNTQVGAYLLTNTGNIAAGNIEVSGNIVGGSVRTTTSATAPANPTPGDMWYDTGADILFRYTDIGTGRYWLDINGQTLSFDLTGNVVAGNVVAQGYYFSNGAPFVSSTYGEANVVAYLGPYFIYANANAATQSTDIATLQTQVYANSNVAAYLTSNITVGNVIPTGNNVVNLGSPTARFGSLYLAGNTIDLGGVTITTAANGNMILSGNLSVAGSVNPSVPLYGNTDVAGYLSTYTGNVAAGNIIVGANVVTTGIKSAAYYFSNGTPFASSSFGNADVATYLPTYTGNIAAGNISVGNVTVGNITVNGWTTSRQTSEVLTALTGATGTVTHDLSTASTFYHTSLSANFTANFTNVPTVNNRIITSTIIMVQGVTPYVPTAVQIDGAAQTIKWNMNAPFAGTASKTDIVSFSLIRVAGAWTVIGSSTYFG